MINKAFLLSLALFSLFFVGTSLALQISPTSITIPSNKLSYYNITFYNNQNATLNISINTALAKIDYSYLFYNVGAKPDTFALSPGQSQNVLFSFGTNDVYFSFPIPINFTYTENSVQRSFVINAPIPPQSASNSIYVYSLAIIVIAAAILLVMYFNRKVVVSKEVIERRASGGFIDVKLAIRVKNISKKPLTELTITDSAPQTALKVSMIGPKEGKVERTSHGMRFVWKELELSAGDELILMYEIKSKIGIVGSVNLSPAECTFKYGNKRHSKKSNSLILNIR